MSVRCIAIVLFAASAVLLAAPRTCRADPPGSIYKSFDSGQQAHNRGEIRGVVEQVDYDTGSVVVSTRSGRLAIAILPSTQIYIRQEYGTLADIRRGAAVDIFVNEVGGRLMAQIIRLK